jgi:hypothetical protein
MAGFNIAEIFANSQLGTQDLARIAAERSGLAQKSAAAAMDVAQGEATTQEQALKDEQKTSQVVQAFSTQIGANADRPDTYIMGTLGATAREYALKAVEQKKQVAALDSVSFFDNPLSYIPNQLEADSLEREANSNAAVADEASKQMQLINQSITTGAAAQEKINHTVSSAMMADKLKAISAQAAITANTIQDKALSFQAEATKVQMEGNKELMGLISQQHSMMMQDEHLKLAKAQFANSLVTQQRQNELLGIQKQDAQIRLGRELRAEEKFKHEQDLIAQQEAAQELMAAELDSTAARLKLNFTIPGDTPQAKLDWIKLNEKNPLVKNKINALVDISSSVAAQKALGYKDIKPVFGEQPSQALLTINTLGAQAGTDKEQKLRTYLDQQWMEASTVRPVVSSTTETISKNTSTSEKAKSLFGQRIPQAETTQTISTGEGGSTSTTKKMEAVVDLKKKPEENHAAFNKYIGYNAGLMTRNVESGADNLYAPPRPAEVASFGQFTQSKFYKEVLTEQVANGATDFSAETVTKLAIDAAAKGIIPKGDVLPLLHTYIGEIINFNNIQYNYAGHGFQNQASYNIYSQLPTGAQQAFDLADPAQLSNFIQLQSYMANRGLIDKLADTTGISAMRGSVKSSIEAMLGGGK